MLVVVLAALRVPKLRFDTSVIDLAPSTLDAVEDARELSSQVGGTAELVLRITGEPAARRAAAEEIALALEGHERVGSVDVRVPIEFFEQRWIHLMDGDAANALAGDIETAVRRSLSRANPLFVDLEADDPWEPVREVIDALEFEGLENVGDLTVRDGFIESAANTATFAFVRPNATIDDPTLSAQAVEAVESAVEASATDAVKIELASMMVVSRAENQRLNRDLARSMLIAIVLVLLVMTLATRRVSTPFVLGLPLLAGLVLTLGVIQLTIGRMNILSGFLLPALAGLGVDFAIHLHMAWLRRIDDGVPRVEAMEQARAETLRPCILAAATSAVAFAALTATGCIGIREYGWMAVIGLGCSLLASRVLLPPLALALTSSRSSVRAVRWPSGTPGRGTARATATAFVVAIAVAGGFATVVEFRNDPGRLRGHTDAMETYRDVMSSVGGPLDPAIFLVDRHQSSRQARELAASRIVDSSDSPGSLRAVRAVTDFLPIDDGNAAARTRIAESLRRLDPDRLPAESVNAYSDLLEAAETPVWSEGGLPEMVRSRFVARDGRAILLAYRGGVFETQQHVEDWVETLAGVQADLRADGFQATWFDFPRILTWLYRTIEHDFPRQLALAIIGVAFFVAFGFRRLLPVAAMLACLVAAFVLTLGVLGAVGREINIFSMMVLPMLVGLGVDNVVHIVAGMGHSGSDVYASLRRCGVAITLSTVTTGIGFGAMAIADDRGIRDLGELSLVGIFAFWLVSVVMLPAVWHTLRERPGGEEVGE